MEVILKTDVEKLGSKDDIVKVKPGYARNYLIPKGMAIPATESNKKAHQEILKQRAFKEKKIIEKFENISKKLSKLNIKITAKAGEKGKIFGSITSVHLSEELNKNGFEINKKQIYIENEPIKQLGKYKAIINLHKKVKTEIEFEVVEA